MQLAKENPVRAIQLFEPDPDVVYTIEAAERLTHVPRRMIAVYCRYGFISPVGAPEFGGYYFSFEGIRTLRRIEYLRSVCGINLTGIKLIQQLMDEVERLRTEARFPRVSSETELSSQPGNPKRKTKERTELWTQSMKARKKHTAPLHGSVS